MVKTPLNATDIHFHLLLEYSVIRLEAGCHLHMLWTFKCKAKSKKAAPNHTPLSEEEMSCHLGIFGGLKIVV
jgi:hypothetical protein